MLLLVGDAREKLKELSGNSIDCVVTSPPYFQQREYTGKPEIGAEAEVEDYLDAISSVFSEIFFCLRPEGTVFLNLGDSYAGGGKGPGGSEKQRSNFGSQVKGRPVPAGVKAKDLIGIPWRVALRLQEDGWWLRSEIIWEKTNPMPESVRDRPTRSHEHIFLLTRQPNYYWNHEAAQENMQPSSIERMKYARYQASNKGTTGRYSVHSPVYSPAEQEGRRNIRTVWEIPTQSLSYEHYAMMPEQLAERCINYGCPEGGTVLDPFCGTGTTLLVARDTGRHAVGIDIDEKAIGICTRRLGEWNVRRQRRAQLVMSVFDENENDDPRCIP